MLNKHISAFATTITYGGGLLQSQLWATPLVFKSVEGIMNTRSFFIVSDDEKVNLQEFNSAEVQKISKKLPGDATK